MKFSKEDLPDLQAIRDYNQGNNGFSTWAAQRIGEINSAAEDDEQEATLGENTTDEPDTLPSTEETAI